MPVIYNGNNIVPAPLVSISRRNVNDSKGVLQYSEDSITLSSAVTTRGIIDADMVMSGVQNIQTIFSQPGKLLEIYAPDNASHYFRYYPVDITVNIEDGVWVQIARYTINMRAIDFSGSGTKDVLTKSDTWQFSEQANGTYQVNHSLSAVGLFNPSGTGNDTVQAARKWCADRRTVISTNGVATFSPLSYNVSTSGTITMPVSGTGNYWNYSAVEGAGYEEGSWNLTENFVYFPISAGFTKSREEYTISITSEQDGSATGKQAQVQGTVYGLTDRDSNGAAKLSNATADYTNFVKPALYGRVNAYTSAGYSVNPNAIARSESYDSTNGTVGYTATFKMPRGTIMANAIDETFDVSDTGTTDIFAEIQVPGRFYGPVVQYMGTRTLQERTATYTATFMPSGTLDAPLSLASLRSRYLSKPAGLNAIFDAVKPTAAYYYVKQNTEEWNPIKLTINKTMSWVIDYQGVAYSGGIGSGISNPQY